MNKQKINRYIILIRKTIKDFFLKWRFFSGSYALYDLLWWICFYARPPFAYELSSFAIRRKTLWLDKYVGRKYADIIEKYKNNYPVSKVVDEYVIWVFWGQGETQMPPLIQACYRQLTHFNKNVKLITSHNVKDYIHLSPVVFEKVKNGQMTWAHFSDIVRTTLLATYGGLWIDATVWVSGELPIKRLSKKTFFTACEKMSITSSAIRFWTSFEWNWSSWCLWSNSKQHILFSFVSDMLQAIAVREKYWPDYVIQDYLIYYTCRTFPIVQKEMADCLMNESKYRNKLAMQMNQCYDKDLYHKLTHTDFVFKLSFRTTWKKETPVGKQTFYGRILSGIIER